jgi:hypothetical protein
MLPFRVLVSDVGPWLLQSHRILLFLTYGRLILERLCRQARTLLGVTGIGCLVVALIGCYVLRIFIFAVSSLRPPLLLVPFGIIIGFLLLLLSQLLVLDVLGQVVVDLVLVQKRNSFVQDVEMHLENFRALENVSSDQRIVGILKVVILVIIFAVLDLLLQLNFHFGILRAPWSVLLPEDKLLEENAVL